MVNDKKDHILDSRKQGKEIDLWGQLQRSSRPKGFLDVLPCLLQLVALDMNLGLDYIWIGLNFIINFNWFGYGKLNLDWNYILFWIGIGIGIGFDIGLELVWSWDLITYGLEHPYEHNNTMERRIHGRRSWRMHLKNV